MVYCIQAAVGIIALIKARPAPGTMPLVRPVGVGFSGRRALTKFLIEAANPHLALSFYPVQVAVNISRGSAQLVCGLDLHLRQHYGQHILCKTDKANGFNELNVRFLRFLLQHSATKATIMFRKENASSLDPRDPSSPRS